MWTTWIVTGNIIVSGYCHVIVYFGTGSQMRHSLIKGVEGSHLFSVSAVRLKWRMSWWRGSGFVSFSSSSSSSSSIAFYVIEKKKSVSVKTKLTGNVFHPISFALKCISFFVHVGAHTDRSSIILSSKEYPSVWIQFRLYPSRNMLHALWLKERQYTFIYLL